jgi:hypothetical protein
MIFTFAEKSSIAAEACALGAFRRPAPALLSNRATPTSGLMKLWAEQLESQEWFGRRFRMRVILNFHPSPGADNLQAAVPFVQPSSALACRGGMLNRRGSSVSMGLMVWSAMA